MSAAQTAFPRILRAWRQQRSISQLELALASNVSQRHVSFLERGRAAPSRDMVLRLGEALDVPLRDRNTMLSAAGFAPRYSESTLDAPGMEAVFKALDAMLQHHDPFPAIVVDRDWNLLMSNPAMDRVFALSGDADALWKRACGDGPRNIFQATLHAEGLRPFIGNWDIVAPAMIARTRREADANQSATLRALLAQFENDPSIPDEWHLPGSVGEVSQPVIPILLRAGELTLSLFSLIATFGTPHDVTTDEVRVESFFPSDSPSEQILRMLAGASTGSTPRN